MVIDCKFLLLGCRSFHKINFEPNQKPMRVPKMILLMFLIFVFFSCKEESKETKSNLIFQKKSLLNNQKLLNKKCNLYKAKSNIKQTKTYEQPIVELLFPKQKSFSVMKAGNNEARFEFYIERKKCVIRQGIKLYEVYFSEPSDDLNWSFFMGVRKDSLFVDLYHKNFGDVDFFFSFREKKKRNIGYIKPYQDMYSLSLDSVYSSNGEIIYKVKYKYNFKPESLPDEHLDENFYLPHWEVKEMYFTKNRGLIKAVAKNNKDGLTYIALPENLK